MNFADVSLFVTTKLIPAINAIMAQVPALLSTTEADVSAAINAVVKVITDLQADFATLVNAVKSST